MKATKRELRYARSNFGEVFHTTLNPEGPGAVRIHLVPPVVSGDEIAPSLAIINGQDIIPVGVSWSILLCEFIKEVNKYSGHPVSDKEAALIRKAACRAVRKVYPLLGRRKTDRDIYTIMDTFTKIARGEEPDEQIGYISIGDYAPFMRAPHRMDLMVSAMEKNGVWNCNQHCVHCYAAGQVHSSEAELTTEEWKRIIDILRDAGVTQVTFTGGEPTMRPDLFELIAYARWFITRLNTNGVLLDEGYVAKLKEASLDSLQITFYSADEAVHNTLVGAPQYARTVAAIENALAAGMSLSVNTPLCTLNRDYLKTLEFLHDKGVIYVTCSGLITTGNARTGESERLQLSEDEIKEILAGAAGYCFSNGMEINFTSPGWVPAGFCEEIGIAAPTCGACLSNMAVTPGGNAVPCQSWLDGEPLGNLLETGWDRIWNGEACAARRDYSAKMEGECPLRVKKNAGSEVRAE